MLACFNIEECSDLCISYYYLIMQRGFPLWPCSSEDLTADALRITQRITHVLTCGYLITLTRWADKGQLTEAPLPGSVTAQQEVLLRRLSSHRSYIIILWSYDNWVSPVGLGRDPDTTFFVLLIGENCRRHSPSGSLSQRCLASSSYCFGSRLFTPSASLAAWAHRLARIFSTSIPAVSCEELSVYTMFCRDSEF